jgi:heterodisulfide reductase subunit A2
MDMRTFGKDFQRYRDHAEKESGVRFVRSRIHSVEPEGSDGALRLSYTDIDGKMHGEVFDLVVLATGGRLPGKAGELACAMNLELNPWGFLKVPPFSPGRSSRKGVYLSGSCVGPMDISESVIAASSASLASSISIHSMGGSLAEAPAEDSPYRNVSRDLPRTAVALCTCSGTLAEGADLDAVTAELAVSSPAGGVFRIARLCTRDGWAELKGKMMASRANRLLIGACTPHVFAGKLKELGESAGIAPSLMDVADVLGSVAPASGSGRGRPAKEILAVLNVGIARIEGMEPVEPSRTGMVQRALVVGGGVAGMTAALSIADHGFEVSLIEESGEFGTHLRKVRSSFQGASPLELLERTIAMTEKHPLIRVHMKTRAVHSQGCMGSFVTTVEKEDGSGETIEHCVTILAPSGKVAETASYCCGRSESVMTGRELKEKLLTGAIDPAGLGTVPMIQCVDSRDENRSYCSRVCCAAALRIALHIKEKNPDVDIVIFYRDLMAYGFQEAHYTEARRAGVVFIQYEPDGKPVVELENGRVRVTARDPILGRDVVVEPDLLALNTGIVPSDHRRVAAVFGVELNEDGFFREACSKWRPVDAMKEGIFLCGIAHSPRSATESIATAHAAAQRSLALLSRRTIAGSSIVAKVRQSLCARCGRCIDACPYGARYLDEEDRVQVSETGCQGCGSCAAVCPNGASVLGGYSDRQVLSMLDAALS